MTGTLLKPDCKHENVYKFRLWRAVGVAFVETEVCDDCGLVMKEQDYLIDNGKIQKFRRRGLN